METTEVTEKKVEQNVETAEVKSPELGTANNLERTAERLLENQRFDEALDFYRRAGVHYKKAGEWEGLGRTLFQQGNALEQQQKLADAAEMYEKSRETFRKIDDKEKFGTAADRLAKVYYWQGKTVDSIKEYEDAIAFGVESSEVFNNTAFLQIELERFDDALVNLDKARELRTKEESNELHITYNNTGIVQFIKGEYEKAAESFKTGIEKDTRPKEEDRSIQYSVFYKPEFKGETFKNYRVFQDVDTKACLMLNYAATLLHKGDEKTAMELLEKALEEDKDQSYLYECAGWIYLNKGDEDKALTYFKKGLPYDPANEDLKKVINLINPYLNAKVGRNDPCPCGSGKKYKKCHG